MDEQHIEKVKLLLTEWNPLGQRASQIADLENYETEAIDILFYINKKSSTNCINKIIVDVLSQAFGLDLKIATTIKYAERMRERINNK
jgi:hypothetical protein